MRKKTVAILSSIALFGVVSLAVANNRSEEMNAGSETTELAAAAESATEEATSADAELVGSIAGGAMDKAVENGLASERLKNDVQESKIIEKAYQAFRDSGCDPAAAVDKAAEVAVEQGWVRSKSDAKRQLRNAIEKARKDESLINKIYKTLGI